MDNVKDVRKKHLIALLEGANALKYGDFTLASGQKSKYYVDGKQLSLNSKVLAEVCRQMAFGIYNKCPIIDAIGGPELGAVPLVGGLLAHWGIVLKLWGYTNDIKGFIVRKDVKGHGLQKLVEGPLDEDVVHNCVVVEDVTTTGGSAMKAVKAVEDLGHCVKIVATVVDREQGARQLFEDRGIVFLPLLTASDFIKPEELKVDWDNEESK